MELEFNIVPLKNAYIAACAAIAATAPDPWQSGAFTRILQAENRPCFVAVRGGEALAFAAFMQMCGTADLELLCVREDCRRQGLGQHLLSQALAALARQGVLRVLLEVRCGNRGAIALYQQLGFVILARRVGMYSQPKEDGFLMALSLSS